MNHNQEFAVLNEVKLNIEANWAVGMGILGVSRFDSISILEVTILNLNNFEMKWLFI